MKRCNACEGTDDSDCAPIDGRPINHSTDLPAPHIREFSVTLLNSEGLPGRLTNEISFVFQELQLAWPQFKRDPIGVGARALTAWAHSLRRLTLAPHLPAACLTAISLVFSVIFTLILVGQTQMKKLLVSATEEEALLVRLEFPVEKPHDRIGVGAGSRGRVGFAVGGGEGSESEPEPARGGGGSGDHNPRPAEQGRIPQPSEISAPITQPLPNAALPIAGVDLDPALWTRLPLATYGDPISKSNVPSKGSGDGGAIGTGSGQGLGDGRGNGVGQGEDGNIGGDRKNSGEDGPGGANGNYPRDRDRIFTAAQVTQRARIIFKPEPQYTEEARRNQITGTAVLRVVFSFSGEVTNIRAIHPLPMGLTEKAIAAARQIRFVPATRNGHPVSVYVQLEYSFNLY